MSTSELQRTEHTAQTPPPVNFLGFTRQVIQFVQKWDGRRIPTRAEIERIQRWWNESHHCCPEAIAMDIRFVYPTVNTMPGRETYYEYDKSVHLQSLSRKDGTM